ncbi:DsbA family protein [Acidithiobacillus sp. MC6.1]|nr:DsbA family protein [Acidithiobacillus sp. MC6.1]
MRIKDSWKTRWVVALCGVGMLSMAQLAIAGESNPLEGAPGQPGGLSTGKPYREVQMPHNLHLDKTVIEVFEYGCPYCRQMNAAMLNWGKSIPKGYRFTQMPALIADQYFPMTMATFGVYETDPGKLQAFEENAFSLVQTYKKPLNAPVVYLTAAHEAGIDVGALIRAIDSPTVKALTAEDAEIMKITQITRTPSLIICGKYVIDPSDTKGNASMFIQLANGLLSRCMMEQGVH